MPVHLAPLSWQPSNCSEGELANTDGTYQNGVIDTPFVTAADENITVYDKTTHEAKMLFAFEDQTLEMSISISTKGTEPIYAELKGCGPGKYSCLLRSASSMN